MGCTDKYDAGQVIQLKEKKWYVLWWILWWKYSRMYDWRHLNSYCTFPN